MTHREFFTVIANGNFDTELVEFATNALAKLDAQGAKAAVRRAEKSNSKNVELIAQIKTLVATDKPIVAAEVATACGVSTQKASAVLRKMVAMGSLRVEDILKEGKACKGYFMIEG